MCETLIAQPTRRRCPVVDVLQVLRNRTNANRYGTDLKRKLA